MSENCEHGNEVYAGAVFPPGQVPYCFICWRKDNPGSPRRRPSPRIALPVADCIHRGDAVPAGEIARAGFDPNRTHYRCGAMPSYGIVTDCKTCGTVYKKAPPCDPSCAGYTAPGESVLITGGIGDFLAIEAHLSPEEREDIGAVYYAAPAAAEIETLFRALPNYPRLREHIRLPTGSMTLYDSGQVQAALGRPLPPGVRDLSITKFFPLNKPYTGSSCFLKTLAEPELPDRPYVVVVPHSTWFAPAGRAFDGDDWKTLFAALDRHDLAGVVLCRDAVPIPSHPRLIDRQGRLSILESIEVLKGAAGYLGIDSWCSVLAAKLFPAHRVSIKNTWGHGWANRLRYWAPWTTFPFVTRQLEVPRWN